MQPHRRASLGVAAKAGVALLPLFATTPRFDRGETLVNSGTPVERPAQTEREEGETAKRPGKLRSEFWSEQKLVAILPVFAATKMT